MLQRRVKGHHRLGCNAGLKDYLQSVPSPHAVRKIIPVMDIGNTPVGREVIAPGIRKADSVKDRICLHLLKHLDPDIGTVQAVVQKVSVIADSLSCAVELPLHPVGGLSGGIQRVIQILIFDPLVVGGGIPSEQPDDCCQQDARSNDIGPVFLCHMHIKNSP